VQDNAVDFYVEVSGTTSEISLSAVVVVPTTVQDVSYCQDMLVGPLAQCFIAQPLGVIAPGFHPVVIEVTAYTPVTDATLTLNFYGAYF